VPSQYAAEHNTVGPKYSTSCLVCSCDYVILFLWLCYIAACSYNYSHRFSEKGF